MNMKHACPECKQTLVKFATKCSCGWLIPSATVSARPDHRCSYTSKERRCPLPGTMCSYPYSSSGPWYCPGHWNTCHDPRLAEAALKDAEENFHKIMAARRDWRRTLFDF